MSVMLNERQKKALRGELTLTEWNEVAPSLFEKGLVGFDPLADLVGKDTPYRLTKKGIEEALALRSQLATPTGNRQDRPYRG